MEYTYTYVWQILKIEWIILHVMAHTVNECLEVVKSDNFTENRLISFDQHAMCHLVIVQIVDNFTYSFSQMCQNMCNLLK